MESSADEVPAKRRRIEGHEKTQIPQETMPEVLLWLRRFDLDGKQITTRRLRSLVEDSQMPLRKVERVYYDGDESRSPNPYKRSTLRILLDEDEKDGYVEVELKIETDADAQKAASYLSSCFVGNFNVYEHRFRRCKFDGYDKDTLSETLKGSTFRCLSLNHSSIPAWQIDDTRLVSLRLRGCNEIQLFPDDSMKPYDDAQSFEVTEEGILSYCFTLDANVSVPETRILRITWATIKPAFFKKVVEASKASQLTCDVELTLDNLRCDVGNLDLGVLPSLWQQYDDTAYAYEHNVRYNVADHGNGIRLLIHFKSEDGEEWEVVMRHGKKEHKAFFEPKPDEEDTWSPSTEYLEHEPELDDHDLFDDDWN